MGMVATYSAAGPDAADATWSLSGADAGDVQHQQYRGAHLPGFPQL